MAVLPPDTASCLSLETIIWSARRAPCISVLVSERRQRVSRLQFTPWTPSREHPGLHVVHLIGNR